MRAFDSRAREFTEYLQYRGGENPSQDRYFSGYITCVMDLLKMDLDMEGTK